MNSSTTAFSIPTKIHPSQRRGATVANDAPNGGILFVHWIWRALSLERAGEYFPAQTFQAKLEERQTFQAD